MNRLEREHQRTGLLIGEVRAAQLRETVDPANETESLYLATWLDVPSWYLCNLAWYAVNGSAWWYLGAMALQNPGIKLNSLLGQFLSVACIAREEYFIWRPRFWSTKHWAFEAFLQNPQLQLLSLEDPQKYKDMLETLRFGE